MGFWLLVPGVGMGGSEAAAIAGPCWAAGQVFSLGFQEQQVFHPGYQETEVYHPGFQQAERAC